MQLSSKFICRCSGIGQIMTNPRSKSEGVLSKTCINYVHAWMKTLPEFYNREKNFRSKYTLKGNMCEKDSIDFAAKYYGWGDVDKNTERKTNSFITGEGDVILDKSVEDIKNSFSETTFPLFYTDIPIDGYGYQLQGYMELYNKPNAGLVYTLMDAPEKMIEREARARMYELGLDDLEAELYDEVEKEMTYGDVPIIYRIKRFGLDRDEKIMELVSDRVDMVNKYIISL